MKRLRKAAQTFRFAAPVAVVIVASFCGGCATQTHTFFDDNSDDDLSDRYAWLSSDREESEETTRQLGGGGSRIFEHWELTLAESGEDVTVDVTWESLGPTNVAGRIISHAFHPKDSGTILIGSASGGLWRTNNRGASWTPLTDRLMSLAVSAVAYNPEDPTSIVIGTGEGYGQPDAVHGAGVFHTTDAGKTWTSSLLWDWKKIKREVNGFAVVWDKQDTSRVYFASSDGVYVRRATTVASTDGESTEMSWHLALPGRTTSLIALPDSVGTLLAAQEYGVVPGDSSRVSPPTRRNQVTGEVRTIPGGLLESLTDSLWLSTFSDSTWEFVYKDVVQDSISVGLFRSVDKGDSWEPVTSFVAAAMSAGDPLQSVGFTSLSAHDESIVYASVSQTLVGGNGLMALMKSQDGGRSWHRLTPTVNGTPANLLCGDPFIPDQCQGRYDNVVEVSPFNADLLFVGGVDLYRSTDGGTSWEIVSKNRPHTPAASNAIHPDNHDFAFDPEDPDVVYSLTDGGLFRSDQRGAAETWVPRNNGLVTLQVTSIGGTEADPEWIAVGAQDNGTHLRTDNSRIWRSLPNFGGDGATALIDWTDKRIIYGERQNGFLQRTIDGGREGRCILERCSHLPMNKGELTNRGITGRGIWHTPLVMDPKNPKRLYTSTLAMMWVTHDGAAPRGVTWHPISPAIERVQQIAIDRVDPTLLYAYSGPSSTFARSYDSGASWTTLPFPGKSISDLQTDPTRRGVLYATRSGPCRCDWDNDIYLPSRVMVSTDAGETWTAIDDGTPTQVPLKAHSIVVLPATGDGRTRILVGTDLGVLARTLSFNSTEAPETDDLASERWIDIRGNLPYVIVRDLEYIAADHTIRAGTYGRGVWRISVETIFPSADRVAR